MSTFKKIVCTKLGTKFAECTEIVSAPLKDPSPKQVLVRISTVGINASDINFTSGHYTGSATKLPFDCGFEGVGTVTAVGTELQDKFKPGDAVVVQKYGCFSEYVYATEKAVFKIPSLDPAYLVLMTSGLTASISLLEVAKLKKGQTVLVTAAAGGTGQFAVQLAKMAGCTVLGTCSSESKVEFLKSIGCDRPINYKTENLGAVLKKEFPRGIDVVYESVGGETFETCVKHLATCGVLIVIGAVSQYQDQTAWDSSKGTQSTLKRPLSSILLTKSASVTGFFLPHYPQHFGPHLKNLVKLYEKKKLQVGLDQQLWQGLHTVPEAIQWLFDGKNSGKVVVEIATPAAL